MVLVLSAEALNFFGIEYAGKTTDNIINLIHSVAEGNEEYIQEYQQRLMKTAPDLASTINIDELKMPCIECKGTGVSKSEASDKEEVCPVCGGEGRIVDQYALGYLQHKFMEGIDAGKTDAEAWKEAMAEFRKRRKVYLLRETMFGVVIRSEGKGLLVLRSGNNETIWVAGYSTSIRKGTPINGYVWPAGTYTYKDEKGKTVKVKRYVANLWLDFK